MSPALHAFLRRVTLALIGCAAAIAILLLLVRSGHAGCALGGSGCELLSHTRYALVLGLPLPAFLVGYYCAYAVAYVLSDRDGRGVRELARFVTLFLALVSVLASTWLTLVARYHFATFCNNCLIITGINLALAALVLVTLHWRTGEATALGLAAVIAGALCVPAGIAAASDLLRRDEPVRRVPVRGAGLHVHLAPARVGVVLDPSCDVCAHQWPQLKQAFVGLEERQVMAGLDVYLLPADPACASHGGYPLGHERPGACRIAAHIFCASYQGRSVEYLDLVYEYVRRVHGDFLAWMQLEQYATFEDALGLDRELQAWCTGDDGRRTWSVDAMPPLTRSAFVALLEGGAALQVDGTPSLVIGERVRSAADLDAREIEAAVLGRQEQD